MGLALALSALACPRQSEETPGDPENDEPPARDTAENGASPDPGEDAPHAESEEGQPMNERFDLYVRRLEYVGFELAATEPEHDPESLGASEAVAFEVEEKGIHLELLLFDHHSKHKDAIEAVKRSGWGGEAYWKPAASGAVLLLARGPDSGTRADRSNVNRLVQAFAGEE